MSETIAEFQFQGPNGFIQLQLEQESMDRYRICVLPSDVLSPAGWFALVSLKSKDAKSFLSQRRWNKYSTWKRAVKRFFENFFSFFCCIILY